MEITKEKLSDKLYYTTMCEAQYGGYPCNTCFHTIIEEDYGKELKEDTHEYWLAVLSFRGDYPELKPKEHLIKELYNKLKGEWNENRKKKWVHTY